MEQLLLDHCYDDVHTTADTIKVKLAEWKEAKSQQENEDATRLQQYREAFEIPRAEVSQAYTAYMEDQAKLRKEDPRKWVQATITPANPAWSSIYNPASTMLYTQYPLAHPRVHTVAK